MDDESAILNETLNAMIMRGSSNGDQENFNSNMSYKQ